MPKNLEFNAYILFLFMLNSRIYLLAFGTFTVGTEGFVVAGLLPEVARDMHASVPVVGQLVTVFALAYAVGAPPLVALSHRIPPRRLLTGASLIFSLANLLAALAPDFALLTLARVIAAAGAALFMAPAAAFATTLSPPEQLPRAIAVTATGNALALTAGAPIGTLIGSALGWRAAFGFVALLAVLTAVLVGTRLPALPPRAAEPGGRRGLIESPQIRAAMATTFGVFLAAYTVYTYLSAVVSAASGRGSGAVAALMAVFGAGGLIGGRSIGLVLARWDLGRVLRTVLLAIATITAVISVLIAAHPTGSAALILLFPMMLVLGAVWWFGGISQQTRFVLLSPGLRPAALSLHFSAQFLGVATAGALGGFVLETTSATGVTITAAVIALLTQFTITHLPYPPVSAATTPDQDDCTPGQS